LIEPGRPRYPKELNQAGRIVFKKLCRLLEERRTLTPGDVEAIRLYSLLHNRHQRAITALELNGEICEQTKQDKDGEPFTVLAPNPWLKIATASERQMLAILVQLGLTPKAKDSVRPTKGKDVVESENLVDSYLSRNKPHVVPMPVAPSDMKAEDDDEDSSETE
jgi:P27 family predicted phage terminase small subunit